MPLVVLVVAAALLGPPARACELTVPTALAIDPSADDGVPPGPVEGVDVDVVRGRGPTPAGCGGWQTLDCDQMGTVELVVHLPVDARGFRVAVVGGEPPEDLQVPADAVAGDRVVLGWTDGANDEQEAVAFELDVVAVDAGGLGGEPVRVAVADPGVDAGGTCEDTDEVDAALLLPLAPLVWVRRRARHRAGGAATRAAIT